MGAVKTLVIFGVGLVGFGFYWRLQNDFISNLISKYIISRSNEYFITSDLFWNALPFIFMFLGVFMLIIAGMAYNRGTTTSNGGG